MGDYTLNDCKNASRACEHLADKLDTSRAMRKYWQDLADMWQGRARDIERASLQQDTLKLMPMVANCEAPCTALGGDEYKCLTCGRIWGRNEQRPNCEGAGQ